jgi:glycosyltransferase involved in cell wall biosynthesis
MTSILVVSEIFWPEGGGAERATYLVLKLLAQQGFRITVVTGTGKPAIIPSIKYYVTRYLKNSNRLTRWTMIRLLATQRAFIRLLKEHDILYVPLAAYPLIPIAKKCGLRVVVHCHNYMPIRYSSVKYFFEPDIIAPIEELKLAFFHEFFIQKSLLRTLLSPLSFIGYVLSRGWLTSVDRMICVLKRQAELISKRYPQLIDKIEVIYDPLESEFINQELEKNPSDVPTFLYVGGDNYIKGFYVLLYILKKLKEEDVRAKFLLAGKYNSHSIELLRNIKRGSKLELDVIGHVSHKRIVELHRESWALLFPSLTEEPAPYAVTEALLLGTIPIVSKIVGPQYHKGAFALLEKYMFNPMDTKDILEKVKAIAYSDVNTIKKESVLLRAAVFKSFRESNDSSLNKLLKVFRPN